LLERPSGGTLAIVGVPAAGLDDNARTALRRNTIGFVYQSSYLLPEFDAVENIVLPQMIAGTGMRPARERARALLARVGLSDRASHRPGRLSGGEQQRVAIARALANEPALLLADEPTGNLDPATSQGIMRLLERINKTGTTVVIATHDSGIVDQMRRRVVELDHGTLVRDQARGVYGYGT
jgi:ABC-type ATPase involved in cell division